MIHNSIIVRQEDAQPKQVICTLISLPACAIGYTSGGVYSTSQGTAFATRISVDVGTIIYVIGGTDSSSKPGMCYAGSSVQINPIFSSNVVTQSHQFFVVPEQDIELLPLGDDQPDINALI